MIIDDPSYSQPLTTAVPAVMPIAPAPFVWGRNAGRLTPEEVAQKRTEAQHLEAAGMDYSPIASPWQGLDRVAQGLLGTLEARKARKAADMNTEEAGSVARALMASGADGPDKATVAAALVNPYLDDTTRSIAGKAFERLYPKAQDAHFFEANNGDQGAIDPVTGQVKILYHDPTPKVQWVRIDNGDGTFTMQPVVNGQMGGAGSAPPATLPPDFDFGTGGPTPAASGNFLGK